MAGITGCTNCLIQNPTFQQEMNKDDDRWERADWSNGGVFNNRWRPQNIIFNDGIMTIKLDQNGCPVQCDGYSYASGEYRTADESFGYGQYEARIKAAKGAGLVTSLFTYTGTYSKPDHDEIDIEILGKNPRQVQFNYYAGGIGGHEHIVDLPFDSSAEFHNYGFIWGKVNITFTVDGKAVCEMHGKMPSRQGKIMVNLWPGTQDEKIWLGGVYRGLGISVQYDWIHYAPLDEGIPEVLQKSNAVPETKPENDNDIYVASSATHLEGLIAIPFKGATGGKIGNTVKFSGKTFNDGMVLFEGKPLDGVFSFSCEGNGPFKIVFINKGNGMEENIGQKIIAPESNSKNTRLSIPGGTNKINVMATGTPVEVNISDFAIAK